MLLTIGYIRLTQDESLRTGLSAPAQRKGIEEYAQRANLSNLLIIEEPNAIGADIPFPRRKGGKQLVQLISDGQVSNIITRDLDRLVRDVPLWLAFEQLCRTNGVTIHTFSGPLATKSPSDRFATTVRAAAAQLEKEQVGDRVRRVKRQMAQVGRPVGGPPPFGYTSQSRRRAELRKDHDEETARTLAANEYPLSGQLYIDESEAETVRLIFDLYAVENLGCRQIGNHLNNLGHRRRSGKLWHADKIRRIIRDPVVAGYIPFDEAHFEKGYGQRASKPDQKLYAGKHQPIVDPKLWAKAQVIRQRNGVLAPATGNTANIHLLSGLIRCPCGAKMKIKTTQFVCRARLQYGPSATGGCDFARINKDRIQTAFFSAIDQLIDGPALVDRVYNAVQRLQRRQPQSVDTSAKRLAEIERELSRWHKREQKAKTEAEQEACYENIVRLKDEQLKLIKAKPKLKDIPKVKLTKDEVASALATFSKSLAKLPKGGRQVVSALAHDHALSLQMVDAETLKVALVLAGVPVEVSQPLPHKNPITAWLAEQQGRHNCVRCGEEIKVIRKHYWLGIPQHHVACWCRQLGDDRRKRR